MQIIEPTVRAEDETLDVGGFRCRYRVSGQRASGRVPVFFLSGAFQTMESWRKYVEHFEPLTTVLVADLPGMGRADLLPRHYGLSFLAEAARSVMDAAGIGRAYVISASYGSPIAYRLAQLHPQRVERMVLSGVMKEIPAHLRARTVNNLITAGAGRMAEFARDCVDGLLCRDPARPIERRRLAERLLLTQLERMSADDRDRYIENTARLLMHPPLDLSRPPAVPVLVFTGESDVYTRPEYCREIAAALPEATFTVIERADHLYHLEQFEVTLRLLDAFHDGGDVARVDGCGPVERFGKNRRAVAVA